MKKPDRPQVTGALAPYAEGFQRELSRQGYSPWTAPEHLYLMAHLSGWLDGRDLPPDRLSPARIEEFLATAGLVARSAGQRREPSSPCWVTCAGWASFQRRWHLLQPIRPKRLAEFASYLGTERGLGSATIASYRHLAGLFLGACAPDPAVRVAAWSSSGRSRSTRSFLLSALSAASDRPRTW